MLIAVLKFVVLQWSQEHNVGNVLGLRRSCHRTMGSFGDQLGCPRFGEDSMHFTDDVQLPINCHRVLWTTIRFGEELRAYADVGYSTITDA